MATNNESHVSVQNRYFNRLSVQKISMEMLMDSVIKDLKIRARKHGGSKRVGLEKEVFAEYADDYPNIWGIKSGDHPEPQDYRAALATHAKNNDYVPGHFEHGIADMSITQLTEMICDIVVSAKEQSWTTNALIAYLNSDFKDRYDPPQPILSIICNSVRELMEEH